MLHNIKFAKGENYKEVRHVVELADQTLEEGPTNPYVAKDLTGWDVMFYIKLSRDGAVVYTIPGIVDIPSSNFILNITKEQSDALKIGNYYHDVWMLKDIEAKQILFGTVTIQ